MFPKKMGKIFALNTNFKKKFWIVQYKWPKTNLPFLERLIKFLFNFELYDLKCPQKKIQQALEAGTSGVDLGHNYWLSSNPKVLYVP